MTIRMSALTLMSVFVASCAAAASPSTLPLEPTTTTAPPPTVVTTTTLPFPETTEPSGPRSRPSTPLATDRAEVPVVDDLLAEVFFPVDPPPGEDGVYPTIVFFHGGSWYGGDPTSTSEFARTVAGQGAVVYNATYLTGQNGGGFPQSYEDVACALQVAGATAAEYGGSPSLVVSGHSAGAHLAATVAMSADAFSSSRCLGQSASTVSGFVGLAGPYDTVAIGAFMAPWFGGSPTDVADAWEFGNPQTYVAEPRFPVTLIHGSGDRLVALESSSAFAELLDAAGWQTELYVVPAATHNSIIDPVGEDGREVAAKMVEVARAVSSEQ